MGFEFGFLMGFVELVLGIDVLIDVVIEYLVFKVAMVSFWYGVFQFNGEVRNVFVVVYYIFFGVDCIGRVGINIVGIGIIIIFYGVVINQV